MTSLTNRSAEHKFTTVYDKSTGETVQKVTYVPIEIEYTIPPGKMKYRKPLDEFDKVLLQKIEEERPTDWFPTEKLPIGKMRDSNHLNGRGISRYHRFYLSRPLHSLSTMWRIVNKWVDVRIRDFLRFLVEQCFPNMSLLNRYKPIQFGRIGGSQVGLVMPGVFYVPTVLTETTPWYNLKGKIRRLINMLNAKQTPYSNNFIISTASSLATDIANNSVDYIYTDPPFGDAIKYGDLNILIEAWYRLFSQLKDEVLWDKLKGKTLSTYSDMMKKVFIFYYQVLKPGRWMTVIFHNSKNSVWTAIQEAIGSAGFVVADVRTLDRKQGSFNQVMASGAVKQDLVISAYKPNGGLENRFKLEAGTEKCVWDFIQTHIKQLPGFVSKMGQAEVIAERQNFLLFDRMVAFHVQHGVTVPLSAAEFYSGLAQRFPERDGMYFLPEQAVEYDKKRLTVKQIQPLALYIFDEASAIQWLKQQLIKKPQTFQDIHPDFIREIGGWKKYEKPLELMVLLEQNFLRYDGKGDVPSQIHSYLSTNFKDMRNLAKDDPSLRAKAKDRWYVPDSNKAGDLEKIRERALLREFDEYQESKQKRLKVFRLEAVRAGFKKAWQERNYQIIIDVAQKIPENILQEDQKLLMWYDQALTRIGK